MTRRRTKPPGWKILVRLKPVEKIKEVVSKGGIIIETKQESDFEFEQQGMGFGHVVQIGSLAFHMKSINTVEPWCEVGDFIMIHKHAGTLMPDLGDGYTYRSITNMDIEMIFPDEADEELGEARYE